jgi:capsular exopolysaccharide synthesis family protein
VGWHIRSSPAAPLDLSLGESAACYRRGSIKPPARRKSGCQPTGAQYDVADARLVCLPEGAFTGFKGQQPAADGCSRGTSNRSIRAEVRVTERAMTGVEQQEAGSEQETLSTALAVLRRRWLIIVAIVLACLAAAYARHATAAHNYAATASVTFGGSSLPDAALQVQIQRGSGDPERDAATNVLVAKSAEVAAGVRRELNTTATPNQLLEQVSVEAAPNANVLHITASSGDPAYSARLANAFATQYIAFESTSQTSSIRAASADLQRQLDALPAGSPNRASIESSLQRLAQLGAIAGSGAQIIGRASVPTSPSGTTLKTTLVLGALIGIALALAVIFLLESLDRRVLAIETFEREYRLPALTSVPQGTFRSSREKKERDAQLEPYRILRSALDFAAITRQLDTLLVTSAVPGEGKTTVAVNLAQTIALTGRPVVLVELDLRRPTFAQHFQLGPRHGITAALAERAGVHELLVQPFPELPNLSVLPAGQLPPNPSELLGSAVMTETLFELSNASGTVVIDAPPLNPIADAQVLLNNPAIHAAIVVARVGHTTRDQVRRARAILDRHNLQPVGLVVTGVRNASRYGYGAYQPAAPTFDTDADADPRVASESERRAQPL